MMLETLSSELLSEAHRNKLKLDACPRHHFTPITPGLHGTRYVCTACKGTVDSLSAKWYEVGMKHGGGDVYAMPA